MDAAAYDAWYRTARGSWIGDTEYRLLKSMLGPLPGESLVDIGCGTGYFTRRFAADGSLRVTGIDPDTAWLAYARNHAGPAERYVAASALSLPFAVRSFDLALSVTALCFVADQRQALREMLRVARRRFALGLLHRGSLLYWQKGRQGGTGAYRGAHWHTADELRALFAGLPVSRLSIRSAVVLPGGGPLARVAEKLLPRGMPWGSFICVAGEIGGQT